MAADPDGLYQPFGDDQCRLVPLTAAHGPALAALCATEAEDFWPIFPRHYGPGHFEASFAAALADAARRGFALFAEGTPVGMSGYLNLDPAQETLEIGGTFLAPAARGTGLNRRFKTLLIDRALDHGFRRIEFRIDARNRRSQAAVARLGAVHEGTLRRQRRIWTGFVRDTQIWSILAEEWRP
ncbi:GNAT family N-acetyltransferase [Sphingomonas morindae]|uniref:GNAT family N-acetyltransferase n=1 Tax=Sphingomonas morindae TaxID=1541170 RepID=A0ABY4X3F7_9SPHN|nr:GNAT family protein [Sphingomonas morindae]USI71401.1 GNAT family N-acetyltransferase [Sphingomonas morindae]